MSTETEGIRSKIKQIIANVAGLDAGRIADESSFIDDLKLDSLSLLEIGVDVDMAFQLQLPDEAFKEIGSLPDMVRLVERRLSEVRQPEPVLG
jgi:acyl carrier protein